MQLQCLVFCLCVSGGLFDMWCCLLDKYVWRRESRRTIANHSHDMFGSRLCSSVTVLKRWFSRVATFGVFTL